MTEQVTEPWDQHEQGVLVLPSGRLIRGRGQHQAVKTPATYSVFLLGKPPTPLDWSYTWLKWRDFWLPNREEARKVLTEAWNRLESERVEVVCRGGKGRTGTALACIAVLDGVDPKEAVDFVRANYNKHAVETPWQRRFVEQFHRVND